MQQLKCLIIEDEPLLADVLKDYISKVPLLELKGIYYDAQSALDFLEQTSVDCIFIDIQLPGLKGIDFIKLFPGVSNFIITTAYHEYAVDAYDLDVVDYLMKPIDFNRFLKAVKKVIDLKKPSALPVQQSPPETEAKNYLFINMNKKRVKVNFNDIVYIESMKEYVKIHLVKDKWLVTKLQIGQMEELLNDNFARIHRSYIIAKNKVISYNQSEVNIGTVSLPVGINFRESLEKKLE